MHFFILPEQYSATSWLSRNWWTVSTRLLFLYYWSDRKHPGVFRLFYKMIFSLYWRIPILQEPIVGENQFQTVPPAINQSVLYNSKLTFRRINLINQNLNFLDKLLEVLSNNFFSLTNQICLLAIEFNQFKVFPFHLFVSNVLFLLLYDVDCFGDKFTIIIHMYRVVSVELFS